MPKLAVVFCHVVFKEVKDVELVHRPGFFALLGGQLNQIHAGVNRGGVRRQGCHVTGPQSRHKRDSLLAESDVSCLSL